VNGIGNSEMDSRQWREFLDTAIGGPPREVTVHTVRRRMMRRRFTEAAAAAAVVLVAVGVTAGAAVFGSTGPGGNQALAGPAVHVKVEAPPKVYVDYVPEQKHPRNIYLPINPATNRAGKPIHVPCAINCLFEAAPNGKTLYIAAGDSVVPLDTRTDKPGTPIKVGKDGAEDINIDPNGKVAYVTGDSQKITPINLTTNTAGKPFKLVTEAGVFAFSADGKTAFVLTPGRNLAENLVPINTATSTPGTQISLGRFDGIALSPDGTTAYLGTKNKITPVSTTSGRQGTSIALPGDPFEMAITPDGKTIVVAIEHGHTTATIRAKVFLISARTGKVSQPIPIPPAAEEVAFTPDSKIVYFASSEGPGRGTTPVNITTGTAGKTIHIGADAQIAMTPDGKTLYATNTQGVIPVDVATDTAGPLIPSPAHGIIQEIGISP
jgi:WD40-like Beta Propeller Repeat